VLTVSGARRAAVAAFTRFRGRITRVIGVPTAIAPRGTAATIRYTRELARHVGRQIQRRNR
jgi:hypothetical protein